MLVDGHCLPLPYSPLLGWLCHACGGYRPWWQSDLWVYKTGLFVFNNTYFFGWSHSQFHVRRLTQKNIFEIDRENPPGVLKKRPLSKSWRRRCGVNAWPRCNSLIGRLNQEREKTDALYGQTYLMSPAVWCSSIPWSGHSECTLT
jgi:hypothetical protein